MLAALVLFLALSVRSWYRHERGLGKFAPLTSPERMGAAWLQEHVFTHPPEVVGAAWDLNTSASEVAAVLARLTQEKKLASEVQVRGTWLWRRDILTLKLLVTRDSLQGYERKLIDRLFVGNGTTTDTEMIRQHYKSSGFDPASALKADLNRRLASLLGASTRVSRWRRQLTLALLLAGAAPLMASVVVTRDAAVPLAIFTLPALLLYIYARSVTGIYQDRVAGTGGTLVQLACVVGALLAVVVASTCLWLFAWNAGQSIGFVLLAAGFLNSIVNAAYTRESAHSIELRKTFAAARAWFARELTAARPQLQDEWYPYLLAFGLGPNVDRWFRVQGSASIASGSSPAGRSSHTGATSAWTGGGGTFGGGGASGSWAAAAGGMAATVAAPSSGSGGGGGGSSGGGGGGGW